MSYSVNEKVRTKVTVCWSAATLSRDNRTAIQTLPLYTITSTPTPASNDTVDFPWGNYPVWQDTLIPVHHNWASLLYIARRKSNICSLVLVLECPASLGYKLKAISLLLPVYSRCHDGSFPSSNICWIHASRCSCCYLLSSISRECWGRCVDVYTHSSFQTLLP